MALDVDRFAQTARRLGGLFLETLMREGPRGVSRLGGSAELWEFQIERFEQEDEEEPPEPGAIVFTGSSSIALWSTLAMDMAPLEVLNRGFGGAHMDHVLHYVDRVVLPYQPRAVVVYAGDNDIGAGKSPGQVVDDFERLLDVLHEELADAPVYWLSIKPSIARRKLWRKMVQANRAVEQLAKGDDLLETIDVSTPMLDAKGEPRPELYWWDRLHMSNAGYTLWSSIVRSRLLTDAGLHAPDPGDGSPSAAGAARA